MINSIEPRTAIKIITTGYYSEVKVISGFNCCELKGGNLQSRAFEMISD